MNFITDGTPGNHLAFIGSQFTFVDPMDPEAGLKPVAYRVTFDTSTTDLITLHEEGAFAPGEMPRVWVKGMDDEALKRAGLTTENPLFLAALEEACREVIEGLLLEFGM